MISLRRHWIFIGVILFGFWIGYLFISHYPLKYPNRKHDMTKLFKNIQTFCIGRFLIDLPEGSTILKTKGSGGPGEYSAEYPITRSEFDKKINERWSAIETMKVDPFDKPYFEPSKRQTPLPDSIFFTYKHTIVNGPDLNGVIGSRTLHSTEAYLWRNKILYSFTNDLDDNSTLEGMHAIQEFLHNQIPAEAGFCGPYSFFPGDAKPESIWIAFQLPTKPTIELRIRTTTFFANSLQRPYASRPNLKFAEADKFKSNIFRDAKRVIGNFIGQEWIDGSTQLKHQTYETFISGHWFYPGKPESSAHPSIDIKMNISYKTPSPPSPWGSFPENKISNEIDEKEFMTYWDGIINTLRPRPGAF